MSNLSYHSFKQYIKWPRYLFEALIASTLYLIFYALSLDRASSLGGFLARKLGPFLSASKVAYKNLTLIFPDKSHHEKLHIISNMWDNLGRIIGELPHWHSISEHEFQNRVQIHKNFKSLPKNGTIFASAHFGNFELSLRILRSQTSNFHVVYRPANNPFVDFIINYGRRKNGATLFAKGLVGVRQIHNVLSNCGIIGMLVDQKTNDGIEIDFLGHKAKTTSLPSKFAIKYGTSIIIAIVKRTVGANYEVYLHQLTITQTSDSACITQQINDEIGKWILQFPEQWFWVHKRWKI